MLGRRLRRNPASSQQRADVSLLYTVGFRFSVSLCFQPVTPGGVGGRDVTDTVTDTVTLLELRPSLSGDQEVLLRYSASPDYPPLELVAYLPDFPFACGREFVFEFRQHKDYFAVRAIFFHLFLYFFYLYFRFLTFCDSTILSTHLNTLVALFYLEAYF